MQEKRKKLEIELVPDNCWYLNLRTALPKKLWDLIRLDAKKRAGYKCAICGNEGEWLGKPLTLQLDHIDGNHTNHSLNNLRFSLREEQAPPLPAGGASPSPTACMGLLR